MKRVFQLLTSVSWQRWALAIVFSLGLHVSFVFSGVEPHKHPPPKRFKIVRFKLLRPKPRKPKPKPRKRKPKPRKRKPKPRKRKKFRKRKKRRRPPPRPRRPLPPPNSTPRRPPPRDAPPPRPIFGVTMSSIAKGKGAKINVRVGNTLMKDPDKKIVPPSKVRPYYAPRRPPPPPRPRDVFQPVPVYEVDENPREVSKVRANYPPEAKRRGIQAKVVLSVEIRRSGRVRRVRVVSIRPASAKGYGFEKAAVIALKKFRFRAARYKGKPVDIVVRYIYRFELED